MRYELKTPWRNGTTHVEWDPLDFIAKLARWCRHRARTRPLPRGVRPERELARAADASGRGKRAATDAAPAEVCAGDEPCKPAAKRRSMSWAQRLRSLRWYGGIVASIEAPTAIRAHFEQHGARETAYYRPRPRSPSAAAA